MGADKVGQVDERLAHPPSEPLRPGEPRPPRIRRRHAIIGQVQIEYQVAGRDGDCRTGKLDPSMAPDRSDPKKAFFIIAVLPDALQPA